MLSKKGGRLNFKNWVLRCPFNQIILLLYRIRCIINIIKILNQVILNSYCLKLSISLTKIELKLKNKPKLNSSIENDLSKLTQISSWIRSLHKLHLLLSSVLTFLFLFHGILKKNKKTTVPFKVYLFLCKSNFLKKIKLHYYINKIWLKYQNSN